MPFFHFPQNNTGGDFVDSVNLAPHVIIEAESPEKANKILRDHGGYFDGVHHGIDCDCCGDRWYELRENRTGSEIPMVYDLTVQQHMSDEFAGYVYRTDRQVIIYYQNGMKSTYYTKKERGYV